MSGFLKKVKHKKLLLTGTGLILVIGILLWRGWYVAAALFCMIAVLNLTVLRKINRQKEPFYSRSMIRNVDYLLIGDMCPAEKLIPAGSSYVQISAPGRNLNSAYEILRHTFSILPEQGGKVILAIRAGNVGKQRYSLFDVPFFNPVTQERLRLNNRAWQSKLPILFAPLRSIQLLFGNGGTYHSAHCPRKDVQNFCMERDLQMIYVER